MARPLLLVLALPILSCGFPVAPPAPAAQGAPAVVPSPEPEEQPGEEEQEQALADDSVVPEGAFATIDELCAAQEVLVKDTLAKANEELTERLGEPANLEPSCAESAPALDGVTLRLAPPFDEVRAILVEAGYETRTHLVVHAADGWRATQKPVVSEMHDDPGCASIRRDGPLHEVRVEKGALVVVGTSSRGDGEEDLGEIIVTWSRVFEDAFACRLERGALRCDESVTVSATRRSSADEPDEPVFATSYVVDDGGHVRPKETYADSF